jgi:hypothetical protein
MDHLNNLTQQAAFSCAYDPSFSCRQAGSCGERALVMTDDRFNKVSLVSRKVRREGERLLRSADHFIVYRSGPLHPAYHPTADALAVLQGLPPPWIVCNNFNTFVIVALNDCS